MKKRYWAVVYEVDRIYGGPEEGGWWYDAGTLVKSKEFKSEDEAKAKAKKWRKKFPDTGASSSVIYRGGDYHVYVSTKEPVVYYPEVAPHYE